MLFCRIRMSKKPNLILRLCYVDYKRKQSDGTYQRTMSKELLMEIFPNRNIRQGIALTKGLHILRYCTTEKKACKVVVVMRILLQPFTSFGCHGYTAGGPSSWTPRREQGEGGMLGSMASSVAALPLFPCIN